MTHPAFTPDLTPEQMARLGVLRHKGSQYGEGEAKDNFFGVSASQATWPESWHNSEHPIGWYQWYQGYAQGKRTADDERQIKRWVSFKARHLAQLRKADPTLSDLSVQPKRRQALLNWGIAPGINVEEEMQKRASWSENRFLTKIASDSKTKFNDENRRQVAVDIGTLATIPAIYLQNKISDSVLADVNKPNKAIADVHTVRHFIKNNLKGKVDLLSNGTINQLLKRYGIGAAYHAKRKGPSLAPALDPHSSHALYGMHGLGKNHAVTMHELGHAKDFSRGPVGLKIKSLKYRNHISGAAGVLSGVMLAHQDTENYAPVVAALGSLPNLRAETMANYHAYHGIKAHKGAQAANRFLTKFVPKQMAGYVAGAAVPVVSSLAGLAYMKHGRDKIQEQHAKT